MSIEVKARNKRAAYEYELLERVEAGIVLQGTEIKSIRQGKVNISDAYVTIDESGEAYVYNLTISPYDHGNRANHIENRRRKLLLHRREIKKIHESIKSKGVTVIAYSLYLKEGLAKLEIVLARGKKIYDKREAERKKDDAKMLRDPNY
ncbi:MAG: SsrA-binding protein SmpB [Oligoflexia bacterium]|nr:SsrA-binding protein SmpB [Oligoflexia bacterium]MBF0363918.1 SsrA-binding protein SmpB [Oligoflexia bacterium]